MLLVCQLLQDYVIGLNQLVRTLSLPIVLLLENVLVDLDSLAVHGNLRFLPVLRGGDPNR